MRRLITVFALIAALFVLMGCGTGSRGNGESTRTYDLVSGDYSGNNGLLYSTADQDKITGYKVALNDALVKKDDLSIKMESLQAELKSLVEANPVLPEEKSKEQSDLQKLIDDSSVSIEAMQHDEIIDLRMTSVKFAFNKDEATSKYSVSGLKIESSKDKDIEKKDEEGNIMKGEDGKPIIIGRDFFFGEDKNIQLNSELSFDAKSGEFSFSFTRGLEADCLTYTLKGHSLDPVDSKDRKGFKEVVLVGTIEVSKISEEKSIMTQLGEWSATHEIAPQGISASEHFTGEVAMDATMHIDAVVTEKPAQELPAEEGAGVARVEAEPKQE